MLISCAVRHGGAVIKKKEEEKERILDYIQKEVLVVVTLTCVVLESVERRCNGGEMHICTRHKDVYWSTCRVANHLSVHLVPPRMYIYNKKSCSLYGNASIPLKIIILFCPFSTQQQQQQDTRRTLNLCNFYFSWRKAENFTYTTPATFHELYIVYVRFESINIYNIKCLVTHQFFIIRMCECLVTLAQQYNTKVFNYSLI